jgi:hypothetical protein
VSCRIRGMESDTQAKLQVWVRKRSWAQSSATTASFVAAPGCSPVRRQTCSLLFMLQAMSSLARVSAESVGGVARAVEEIRIAEEASRLRNLRRLRLRAAVLTIDQLLEQLEVLNLQGRSRSLSAWHRRLFSLGRLDPKATSLELTSETSPQHLMDELFELQERLLRDLAGPRWDPSLNGEP